ncbi:YheC/YheD family protein [Paenibacillus sp. ACRRX]|uniref:YheC/YheD family endospore coat-associated protein n=1 Tax=unclassified Paenibacillus TaxID=185978 RepID=UPI001EF4988D|nr:MULTISPECIES: YheC/YheD family protein [unclassified Paenibacillus]MCG7406940.1 YheC/YheD family protein [Paenibacillus sp. ACRRX]MDK8179875.1 YheC/YheD family protein [Paenibacillus sp. UMB4589-SE434]
MSKPLLGILTLYKNKRKEIEERHVYEKMIVAGHQLDMDVCVFTPQDVDHTRKKVHAMVYHSNTGVWTRKWSLLPDLIFDRCRNQRSAQFSSMKHFRAKFGHLTFLNQPLRNKWKIYKMLSHSPEFRKVLPDTVLYSEPQDIYNMLNKVGMVYVKPINGTGGRGILRLERKKNHPNYLYVEGRNRNRRVIRPQYVKLNRLRTYMKAWAQQDRYIVQRGIALKLSNGKVHDYRMLVQKDEYGKWSITGSVGRVGAHNSVTSNLHGGGHAVPMRALLQRWIGDQRRIDSIQHNVEKEGIRIVKFLEKKCGSLCELALDWAIDKQGRYWLLEVNPKPSREVFKGIGDKAAYHKAVIQPIRYAKWIYMNKSKR